MPMTTTDRRTQQQRRDQAETALLNAAAELVVEQGVHSLTLARVGERARYSRGLVTHYFGSKQALLQRLAHATQSGFVPGLDGMPPGLDRLLRLIDGYIGALSQLRMPNRAFLLLWAEAATVADLAQLRGIGLQRLVDSPAVDTERLRHSVTEYWRLALALPQPPA